MLLLLLLASEGSKAGQLTAIELRGAECERIIKFLQGMLENRLGRTAAAALSGRRHLPKKPEEDEFPGSAADNESRASSAVKGASSSSLSFLSAMLRPPSDVDLVCWWTGGCRLDGRSRDRLFRFIPVSISGARNDNCLFVYYVRREKKTT